MLKKIAKAEVAGRRFVRFARNADSVTNEPLAIVAQKIIKSGPVYVKTRLHLSPRCLMITQFVERADGTHYVKTKVSEERS